MANHSFCDRLWAVIEAAVNRRVDEVICAPDNRPARIRLNHVTVAELTQPPEEPEMAVQTLAINISGDAPFGYLVEGITYDNRAGNQIDPAPDPTMITGTSDDPSTTIVPLSGGRAWIKVNDAAPVGQVVNMTLSVDIAGTSDDAVITATYVADRPGAVNLAGATVTEAAVEPAP